MGSIPKIYGGPLQGLYRRLQDIPGAPRQPEILREVLKGLQRRGLTYHPRTVKRQLLGDIGYIPAPLEEGVVGWLREKHPQLFKRLIGDFEKQKKLLETSNDADLYVSPNTFIEMANAYLFVHKDLSRRKLAMRLKASLQSKNISIGIETLQAALAGKTLKVRKVLEDEMLECLGAEGYTDRAQIRQFLDQQEANGSREIQKVQVGKLSGAIDSFLAAHGLSKRQLALLLRDRLAAKGYVYHLSSIQSILEGKTQKTRRVILDTIQELLATGQEAALRESEGQVPAANVAQNRYVQAEQLTALVGRLLESNPRLTRRRIAIQLRQDLAQKNLAFSLNTLQFILAGKTQRTKQAVVDLLEEYLQKNLFANLTSGQTHRGRRSLDERVREALEKLKTAEGENRDAYFRAFLAARADLIRQRWNKLHPPARRSSSREWNFNEGDAYPEGVPGGGPYDLNEAEVAYNVEDPFNRLVS